MRNNKPPKKPSRRSTRVPGYDYSNPGAYYVTICTQQKWQLLSRIVTGKVQLTRVGEMVRDIWLRLPQRFPTIEHYAFVIMPNHLHGELFLNSVNGCTSSSAQPSLSDVVQCFKSESTVTYFRGVREYGWPEVPGRLWQRGFYDRIVRDEDDLERIREYIDDNPLNWEDDDYNPKRKTRRSRRRRRTGSE